MYMTFINVFLKFLNIYIPLEKSYNIFYFLVDVNHVIIY